LNETDISVAKLKYTSSAKDDFRCRTLWYRISEQISWFPTKSNYREVWPSNYKCYYNVVSAHKSYLLACFLNLRNWPAEIFADTADLPALQPSRDQKSMLHLERIVELHRPIWLRPWDEIIDIGVDRSVKSASSSHRIVRVSREKTLDCYGGCQLRTCSTTS
jgi:hypothetical protein